MLSTSKGGHATTICILPTGEWAEVGKGNQAVFLSVTEEELEYLSEATSGEVLDFARRKV